MFFVKGKESSNDKYVTVKVKGWKIRNYISIKLFLTSQYTVYNSIYEKLILELWV